MRGSRFLVAAPRHGWREFIENTLRPSLPEGVQFYWQRDFVAQWPLRRLIPSLAYGRIRKPCLVELRCGHVRYLSLGTELLPLRGSGRKKNSDRSSVRDVLERAVGRLDDAPDSCDRFDCAHQVGRLIGLPPTKSLAAVQPEG